MESRPDLVLLLLLLLTIYSYQLFFNEIVSSDVDLAVPSDHSI